MARNPRYPRTGIAVDGCEGATAKKGRHEIIPQTVRFYDWSGGGRDKRIGVEAQCRHCGMWGSRILNPNSFNWD